MTRPRPDPAPDRAAPDSSAVRTALWRALQVQIDAEPHLMDDEIGLALADPGPGGWRSWAMACPIISG